MSKRKRLCIDINSIVPLFVRGFLTGVGRTTFELVKEIDKIKEELPFDVLLYLQNIRGITPADFGISLPYRNLCLPFRDYINKYISPFYIRTALTKYDLWHCPHNIGQADDVQKTIFTIHDMIAFRYRSEFEYEEKERGMRVFSPIVQKSKAVITCSQSSKNDIAELMGISLGNIHVAYWGVRHDLFKPLVNKELITQYLFKKYNVNKPYFFAVSCGYGRKNTLQLLEAYTQLLKNNPSNDLVVIWNNYGEDVAQLIEKGKGRIHILDNVRDEDLVQLYNGATSLFFPSSYEGFGLPILEAMACGIPVVTCDNSSLREVGGEVAIYVQSPDVSHLKEIMEIFENGTYDLNFLSKRGIERASTFTWEKCARETLDIYATYLNG